MSAVDVLAAYDRAMAVCNDDITDTGEVANVFDELREARAAVAELMEHNRIMRAALEKIADETAATWVCDTANAALARCRGEGACS